MKKKYIAPSVEVIKVQAANMMAQSFLFYNEISVDPDAMLGREIFNENNVWEW